MTPMRKPKPPHISAIGRRKSAKRCAVQVPHAGLDTPFRNGTLLDMARDVLAMAEHGLEEPRAQ